MRHATTGKQVEVINKHFQLQILQLIIPNTWRATTAEIYTLRLQLACPTPLLEALDGFLYTFICGSVISSSG